MAATDRGALAALMGSALALPILALPAKAVASEVGEVGITVLGYKERGLMKVTEPIAWLRAPLGEDWEVSGSAAIDIITGASPRLVTNQSGTPVQVLSGASISDRRKTGDVKLARRFGDFTLAASRAVSNEEDYRSRAWGLEGRLDLAERNTTITAGYGRSKDRVRSVDDSSLDAPRDTSEYLVGVTQVLSPTSIAQATLTVTRGEGRYDDPYKFTITFRPGGIPAVLSDRRPDHRDTVAFLGRWRAHFPAARGTLQADYRFFRDDWGIRAHTLEVAWEQAVDERWSLRPSLRYYTQGAADFYHAEIPLPTPAVQSSDPRLGSFGGLSPALKATLRLDGVVLEATLGAVYNAASLRPGGGSPHIEPLRAAYGMIGATWSF